MIKSGFFSNKFIRNYREKLCRKFSRTKNLYDLFTRLIALSDPLFHKKWEEPNKKLIKKDPYPSEVLKLLKSQSNYIAQHSDSKQNPPPPPPPQKPKRQLRRKNKK